MIEKFLVTETFSADSPHTDLEIVFYNQFPAHKLRSYHEILMLLPFEPDEYEAEVEDVEVIDHTVEYDPRIWGWTWRVETKSFRGGWLRRIDMRCKMLDSWNPESSVLKRRWIIPPDPIQKLSYTVKLPEEYAITEHFAHFMTDVEKKSEREITFSKELLEMGFKRMEFKLHLARS
ncbi:MAG: hypothetical protein ACTSYX_11720 [Candidatus Thorarchaeota archaeon]